jgi:hypothetical protein
MSVILAADCDNDHYQVVAKIKERISMNKQGLHRFHMEIYIPSEEVKRARG